jgi:hydrogenase maturation protease
MPDAPDREAGGVLVIGYGNTLRSDDGVGANAARALAADPRLAGARVIACHQLAPELAADMADASLVVLIDASVEAPPGAIEVRRLSSGAGRGTAFTASGAGAGGATSHRVGAEELVALAAELYGAAPEVLVVSVGVATMETGEELSPEVAAALPGVADAVGALVAGRLGPAG